MAVYMRVVSDGVERVSVFCSYKHIAPSAAVEIGSRGSSVSDLLPHMLPSRLLFGAVPCCVWGSRKRLAVFLGQFRQ